MQEQLTYQGFLTDEAITFFGDKRESELRDGCGAVGTFIMLSNGKTHMPSKGDVFMKDENSNISLIS